MGKSKNDVSTRAKWKPPEDYVPRTTDEYLLVQQFIRDMANEELVDRIKDGIFKGVAALQRLALDAAQEVDRVEDLRIERERRTIPEDYSSASIGFELEYPGETREA
jgi:hypothetical protein